MTYRNGRDLLPPQLLQEIQKYIQGETVYIPRKQAERASWGEINGTKQKLEVRNRQIYQLYYEGSSIATLAEIYHLSEDSIRKVLQKFSSVKEKERILFLQEGSS